MSIYLEERIKFYYEEYRAGRVMITDKQFDQLEKIFSEQILIAIISLIKKVLLLTSLEKDSIEEFIEGLLPDTRLLIEPKIDGCAIALQFRYGNLEKAISRKGSDVTSKIEKVQDVPN